VSWPDELSKKIFGPGPSKAYGRARPGLARYIGAGGGPRKFVKCRNKDCNQPMRNAPGATRCIGHRWEENAGCAEHDKVNCPLCKEVQ
jgi:hypothetical protein